MKIIGILLAFSTSVFAQGPLPPPVGPPVASMKTLTQVEPRTPIETLPVTISTAGSYYFAKNLQFTETSGTAIKIASSNVTLDLNGFALSSTAGVTSYAIFVDDNLNNIAIKNGSVSGNTTVAVSGTAPNQTWTQNAAGFSHGIYATATSGNRNLILTNLQVSGCRYAGIYVDYCNISNSSSSSNGGTGIAADHGCITHTNAFLNGGTGISAARSSVSGSGAASNKYTGIAASQGSITNSSASDNGGIGILASFGSVTNSTANSNGLDGISASSGMITSSNASFNGQSGINAYEANVTSSIALSNGRHGIDAVTGSVSNCKAMNNNSVAGTYYDLNATNALIAFSNYGTGLTSGSVLTGNKTP